MPFKRSFRVPYDTPVIHEETKDAYALADEYVPQFRAAWLQEISRLNELVAALVFQGLEEYYESAAVITWVESNPLLREALEKAQIPLAKLYLRIWDDTRAVETLVQKDYNEAIYDELANKPELTAEAMAYAETQSAVMVTTINDSIRTGIRGAVTEGVEQGLHPRVIARKIRATGIGLAEKGPHTYDRVRRYMISQMEAGVSDKVLEKRVQRFHNKLLKERAESIAQTEMMDAQAQGRRATWIDEQKLGLVDPNARRVWIAGIARTCPECTELDGMEAPLNGPYPTGDMGPPLHPRCRCTEGLRLS